MGISTDLYHQGALHAAVGVLTSEAKDQDADRRKLQRDPYLKIVLIERSDGSEPATAFTREISSDGIGLFHAFPLEPKDTVVMIVGPDDSPFRLQIEIVWCAPLGDDWFVSGGQFIARLDS